MSLYSAALFVHIVGALLIFVLLTIEGVGLRSGMAVVAASRILGPISALFILVAGLYMVANGVGWKPWVVVGIVSYLVIAALGAFTGISVMRGRMSARTATVSWLVRVGIALGVVFDMTVKPDLLVSITAVLLGVLVGAAASVATAPREVRSI